MKFRVPGSGLDVASVSCSSPEDKEESIEYAGQKFWDGELPQHPWKLRV